MASLVSWDASDYEMGGNQDPFSIDGIFSDLWQMGKVKLAQDWGIAEPVEASGEYLTGQDQRYANPAMYPGPVGYNQNDGTPLLQQVASSPWTWAVLAVIVLVVLVLLIKGLK